MSNPSSRPVVWVMSSLFNAATDNDGDGDVDDDDSDDGGGAAVDDDDDEKGGRWLKNFFPIP